MNERMTSGISGLDEILGGGLIPRNSYLLVGGAGTGKTILSLQWLIEGVKLGEKVLYITLAERAENVQRNITSFNWPANGINILDLSSGDEQSLKLEEYHVFTPSEVEQDAVWEAIYTTIKEQQPQRLVIDSATQLHFLSTDDFQFRNHMLAFVRFLNKQQITSMLLYETTEFDREVSLSLAVDAIIKINMELSVGQVVALRSLQVIKTRGSDFISGSHPFKINNNGIHVFPHHIETAALTNRNQKTISSGVSQLDDLLCGGVDSGTVTIISGPTGIGKTTIGAQFIRTAAQEKSRGIIFSFEETTYSLAKRCREININLDDLIEQNLIKIVHINSMEMYPDEFLELIRTAVEKDGFEFVMIDSLRGYQLAMQEFGSLLSHVHNLFTYLNRKEITTFLIDEVEELSGNTRITEMGISHLADNILLLRYIEHHGRIAKIIGCLKKRLSDFQPELRQLNITSNGIQIADTATPLQDDVLINSPTFS